MKKLITILMMALSIFTISCGNLEPEIKEYKIDEEYVLTIPKDNDVKQPIKYPFNQAVYEPGANVQVYTFLNKDIHTTSNPATDFFDTSTTVNDLKTKFVTAFNNLNIVKDGVAKPITKSDVKIMATDENGILKPSGTEKINGLLDKAGKSINFMLPPLEFLNADIVPDIPQALAYMIVVLG